jgi:hypothetical protein
MMKNINKTNIKTIIQYWLFQIIVRCSNISGTIHMRDIFPALWSPALKQCHRKKGPIGFPLDSHASHAEEVKPAGKPGSVTGIAPYDGHSSRRRVAPALQPPTRGLERATHNTPRLRVQHPPIWCCSGWRLPRFTRRVFLRQTRGLRRSLVAKTRRLVSVALFLVFAKGKPSTSTYGR